MTSCHDWAMKKDECIKVKKTKRKQNYYTFTIIIKVNFKMKDYIKQKQLLISTAYLNINDKIRVLINNENE